mmetsp:Transcript_849/g.1249  ORF Transcript_849/g.1249 Transcript_849/m.1249 type:complete len:175 (-) Transcript_849:1861-2385(-)
MFHIWAYSPSNSNSSLCVPLSTIFPLLRTMIWSALLIVESLWAMVIVVRFFLSLCRASCTPCSVLVSRALVASSNKTIGGFFSKHLAIATLCFSPPDNFSPLSPTVVSHLSVKLSMKGRICAASAAASISSIVASSFPYRILCKIVSLNMTVSWGTTPMVFLTDFCCASLMSVP